MIKGNAIWHMALLCLILCAGLTACTPAQANKSPQLEQQKVLRHVVALRFKEGVSEEKQAWAIQNFRGLLGLIPEIKSFEGGADMSVEGFTKDFTHCFILTFENEAARDVYLPHPEHLRVAKENKPLMSDLLVLDVWGTE